MRDALTIFALATLAFSSAAWAEKGGHGNGHGDKDQGDYQDRQENDRGYGGRDLEHSCPPGLAKKHNGCRPPGQVRNEYARGQYLPLGYSRYTAYSDIPESYRSRIRYGDRYRYIYQDNRVYVVDRTTRLIRDIVQLLR